MMKYILEMMQRPFAIAQYLPFHQMITHSVRFVPLLAILLGFSAAVSAAGVEPTSQDAFDSDGDGIPDDKDPSPLVADFTSFTWEVHTIRLGWKVEMGTKQESSTMYTWKKDNASVEVNGKKVTKTKNVSFDGQGEGRIGFNPSINPLKSFGLSANISASLHAEGKVAYSNDVEWNVNNQQASSECADGLSKLIQETQLSDLHISFWITFHNLSNDDLYLHPADLTIYSGDGPVCQGSFLVGGMPAEKDVLIPADRPEGITFECRAKLDTTNALSLIEFMRSASPSIKLEDSGCVIRDDKNKGDAISAARHINRKTIPFTVCTDNGSIRWLVAYKNNPKLTSTTIGEALCAVNDRMRPYGRGKEFFGLGENGIETVSTMPLSSSDGRWTLKVGGAPMSIGPNTLKEPLAEGTPVTFTYRCFDQAKQDLDTYYKQWNSTKWLETNAPSRLTAWQEAADSGIPEAMVLLARCYQTGCAVSKDDDKAFEWWKKAADKGSSAGINGIGLCYSHGEGVMKDDMEAIKWYRKAAEQGNARAQRNIGCCYATGQGVTADKEEAVKWYRKAAEQGNADAQNDMGYCYATGQGVVKDDTEAVKWSRKAAEQGDARAQRNIGCCYATGQGVTADKEEAVKWYRKAAEQGLAQAQCNLGYCYSKGQGVTEDKVEAAKWFRKAAEQGNVNAQLALGIYYYSFVQGAEKDKIEAVKWFLKAAEQGNAMAQVCLGQCYDDGQGVAEDKAEAAKWYRKGAEQGNAQGQFLIGLCYATGRGVTADMTEAAKWYRKAAEQGHDLGQFFIGFCYATGKGVTADMTEAAKWYRKAAEQGNAMAQVCLGQCYDDGQGVAEDKAEAAKWYRKGAEQGNAQGQFLIGLCYATGKGVTADMTAAAKWYRKAAEQGHADAQFYVGKSYEDGQGVEKNLEEALVWYLKAAEQGHAEAQCCLGRCYWMADYTDEAAMWFRRAAEQGNAEAQFNFAGCYVTGKGVPKSEAEAVSWFRKAAAQGHVRAQNILSMLGTK